jgi:hypothetical protein
LMRQFTGAQEDRMLTVLRGVLPASQLDIPHGIRYTRLPSRPRIRLRRC